MTNRETKLFGLDDFGLTIAALRKLGTRKTRISIQQKAPPLRPLMSLKPAARQKKIAALLDQGLVRMERLCPPNAINATGEGAAWTLDAKVSVKTAIALSRLPNVSHVWFERIEGVRRRRRKTRTLEWFAVLGEVAIEIEGQVRGNQTLEDRIVLVKARNEGDAKRRLTKEWQRYATPYLNPDGYLVRWRLQRIVDVYAVPEEEIDDRGTEVFSRFRKRRMRLEFAWHPATAGDRDP